MSRFLVICALILFVPLILSANEFDWLVREFSHQSGARQTYIPLFGLVRFSVVGHEWKPMLRVRSRNHESTNIYAQQLRPLIG